MLPNVAFRMTKEKVRSAFQDQDAQHDAVLQLGSYQNKVRTLRRHAAIEKPPKIDNPHEIPIAYKVIQFYCFF